MHPPWTVTNIMFLGWVSPHLVRKLQQVISARDALLHYHFSICYILQVTKMIGKAKR